MAEQSEPAPTAANRRRTPYQRHAAHYIRLAAEADEQYLAGGDGVQAGLAQFDRERAQLDAARAWLQNQPPDAERDALQIADAEATVHLGELRYHVREQRIPQLQCALEAAQRQRHRAVQGDLLNNLGNAYMLLGDARIAVKFYEQDLVIVRELNDRHREGGTLGNLGNTYLALGESLKALDFFEQHLVITRETHDRRAEGTVLGNIGLVFFNLGKIRQAIEFFNQHRAIAYETGDRRSEGSARGNLGNAYHELGEIRAAISCYEQHLAIAREIGDQRSEGMALGNLGLAYQSLGEVRKGLDLCEQYLAIAREVGDRRGEGIALGGIGLAYQALGEVDVSIGLFEQVLTIVRELSDRRSEGTALGHLGNAYRAIGEIPTAIGLYEQELAIARAVGSRRAEGRAIGKLGNAYLALGEVRTAIRFYEQHLTISRETDDRRQEGNLLNNLGVAYAALRESQYAQTYYEQAIIAKQAIEDHYGVARTYWSLGMLLVERGDIEAGLPLLEQIWTFHCTIGHAYAGDMATIIKNVRAHGKSSVPSENTREPEDHPERQALLALLPEAVRVALEHNDQTMLQHALATLTPQQQQTVMQALQEQITDPRQRFAELLHAIVRVAHGETALQKEVEQALAQLEQNGWHLSAAVQHIWAGVRNLVALTDNLDEQDTALIAHVLGLLAVSEQVAAPTPSKTDQGLDMDTVVRDYLPLLSDIALAAHGDTTARALAEARLPWLETRDWYLTEVAERIWAGERDPEALTTGLDSNHHVLVHRILEMIEDGPSMALAAETLRIAHIRREIDVAYAQVQQSSTEERAAMVQQLVAAAEQVSGQPGAPWAELAAHLRALARELGADGHTG